MKKINMELIFLNWLKNIFKVEDIRDFSSNINPFGASQKSLDYVKEHLYNVSIYL